MTSDGTKERGNEGTLGWRVDQPELVADYRVFRVQKVKTQSPRNGETFEFNIIDRRDCVLLIPFTTDGRVILVEQFRPGIQAASLEFPAGVMDEGEEPVGAARRELEEETGYRAQKFEIVGDVFQDPALLNTRITFIAAFDCAPTGEKQQDDAEDVHTQLRSIEEVDQLIADGTIKHSVVIAAWHMVGRELFG